MKFKLSDNYDKQLFKDFGVKVWKGKHIEAFIQVIKATMLITPSPTERGKFIIWLMKEIDKLAGDELI